MNVLGGLAPVDILRDGFRNPRAVTSVWEFGAIGKPLAAQARLVPGSKNYKIQLTIDPPGTIDDWFPRAPLSATCRPGIGLVFTLNGRPQAARFRVYRIDRASSIITLYHPLLVPDPGPMVAVIDDSLPIQDALDAGGQIDIPTGTYVIGTPWAADNQPLVLRSDSTVLGDGPRKTILRLADEVRQARPKESLPYGHAAIFITEQHAFWYALQPGGVTKEAHDIELGRMTLDGNRDGQSDLFSPGDALAWGFPAMERYTLRVDLGAAQDGGLSPNTYEVRASYVYDPGNGPLRETSTSNWETPVVAKANSSLIVSLPEVPPALRGRVRSAILYLTALDPARAAISKDGAATPYYADAQSNVVWQRITVPLDPAAPQRHLTIRQFDPAQATAYAAGVVKTNRNGAFSCGFAPSNLRRGKFHEIETWNHAIDGFFASSSGDSSDPSPPPPAKPYSRQLRDTEFDRIESHHNGRQGMGIPGEVDHVDFLACLVYANESGGCDMEDNGYDSKANGYRALTRAQAGDDIVVFKDVLFDGCVFSCHLMPTVAAFALAPSSNTLADGITIKNGTFSWNQTHVRASHSVAEYYRPGVIQRFFMGNTQFMQSLSRAIVWDLPVRGGRMEDCPITGHPVVFWPDPPPGPGAVKDAKVMKLRSLLAPVSFAVAEGLPRKLTDPRDGVLKDPWWLGANPQLPMARDLTISVCSITLPPNRPYDGGVINPDYQPWNLSCIKIDLFVNGLTITQNTLDGTWIRNNGDRIEPTAKAILREGLKANGQPGDPALLNRIANNTLIGYLEIL